MIKVINNKVYYYPKVYKPGIFCAVHIALKSVQSCHQGSLQTIWSLWKRNHKIFCRYKQDCQLEEASVNTNIVKSFVETCMATAGGPG